MIPGNSLRKATIRTEDAVINGLFSGVAAGLVMILFLALSGLVTGHNFEILIGLFDPSGNNNPISGIAAHMAVSGVYGLLFGLLWKILKLAPRRLMVWLGGMIFSLLIFAAAELLILPGSNSPLIQMPELLFGLAHLVYGFVLGFGFSRSLQKT